MAINALQLRLVKVIQQGFQETMTAINEGAKVSKTRDINDTTIKGLQTITNKMDHITKVITASTQTNQDIKKLEQTVMKTKDRHVSCDSELTKLKNALDDVTEKFNAQKNEISCLRNELSVISNKMNKAVEQINTLVSTPSTSNASKPSTSKTEHLNKDIGNIKAHQAKNTGIIIGQKKTNEKLVASIPQTSLFVSKISLEVNETDLLEYLNKNFGPNEKFKVEKVAVKSEEYNAYKITARKELEDNLLNANNWPENISINKFTFFRPQQSRNFNKFSNQYRGNNLKNGYKNSRQQ